MDLLLSIYIFLIIASLILKGGGRNWNPSNNGIIFDEEEPLLNTKDSTNNNVNCGYDVSLTFLNNWKTIDSPRFPFDYPPNSHCYYNIYSPEGTKIGLECPDFYVEESYYDCKDKFEWSVSGDWSLWSTQYTCGLGIINQTSISNRISFALHTDTDNRYSQYFYRFRCTVKIISPPSPSKCSCGVSSLENRISPRIVNGETTVQGAYPWRCILRCEVLGDFCGCTIINKDWILTAAHCSNALRSGPGYEVYVNVGDYDIKDPYEADNRIIRIEKIIGHQNYSVITQDNDIALMKLEKSLSFTEPHIQPVCLPFKFRQNGVKNGSTVVAAGWGLDSYGGDQVDKLQEVKLTLLETKYCRSKGHYEARYLTDNMFCTYYEKNGVVRDTCQGDSGGTIDIQDGNRYFALGIVSWGIACAVPDKPGACTNILLYLDWIKDVTKETCAVFCEIN